MISHIWYTDRSEHTVRVLYGSLTFTHVWFTPILVHGQTVPTIVFKMKSRGRLTHVQISK